MSLIIFWSQSEETHENDRYIYVRSCYVDERICDVFYVNRYTSPRNIYAISERHDILFYPSFNIDDSTEKYSIGGKLQIVPIEFDKIFTDIEYNEVVSGTLDFHKIFFHQPNTYGTLKIIFKLPPKFHQLFIPVYENYLEETYSNQIIDVFSKNKLRFYTHFELYENVSRETNIIKIKKLRSIPWKNDPLAPNLWKDIFTEYMPKYIDIGDKIVFIIKKMENLLESSEFTILNIEEKNFYYEVMLDQTVSNLNKDTTIISHVFDFRECIGSIFPHIENFQVNSHTGNYRINDYPIELNLLGTLTERVKIEFFERNKCNVIMENNGISYGPYDIENEDIEVLNNFIDGNPLWFKMDKNGFIGHFEENDTIEFDLYGNDYPIWIIRYFHKDNILLYNKDYKEKFIVKVV